MVRCVRQQSVYFVKRFITNNTKSSQRNDNTVQGYNSEENHFKIILFLSCRRILVRSATFDSHLAARGRSWIPLGNWSLGPGVLRGPRKGPEGPSKKLSSILEACCV